MPRVQLFLTCLVDFLYPDLGAAAVRVLRRFGVEVDFPANQTCCGQPAFNAGFRSEASVAARTFLDVFGDAEAVVSPSGSCVAMVREHFPHLLKDDPALHARMEALASRTWELSQYLTDVLRLERFPGRLERRVAWHQSCHSLRSLGIREGPRRLLASIEGLELVDLPDADVCCGFGGLFSVKFDEISAAMLRDKTACAKRCGAEVLSATDASCLAHIDGGLRREKAEVTTLHLAEILALALDGERVAAGRAGGESRAAGSEERR